MILAMKRVWKNLPSFVLGLLTVFAGFTSLMISPALAQSYVVTAIDKIVENGGRVDWQPGAAHTLIAFDQEHGGRFDIYTMNADDSNKRCITCENTTILGGGRSNPAWHPSGLYLVSQVEKPGRSTHPGFGQWSDLWLISLDGKSAWPLTNLPDTPNYGVLHPHFSADGRRIAWSQMRQKAQFLKNGQEYGFWTIYVADFALNAHGPQLSNIRSFEPMGPALYENHGFSPDGTTLFFSSNANSQKPLFLDNDIYSLNLISGKCSRLTVDGYNEHAEISPDGGKIVWMSSNQNANKGTDLWLMNLDGSDKERLTHFNQPGFPESSPTKLIAADSAWSPDGQTIVAYVQDSLLKQTGSIYLIHLQRKP